MNLQTLKLRDRDRNVSAICGEPMISQETVVAELKLSPSTLWRMRNERGLRSCRVGKEIFYRVADLGSHLSRATVAVA